MEKPYLTELPPPEDPSFRTALKEAREARNLTQYKLAKLAGIAQVMPARYEDSNHQYATLPTPATWEKLNAVLFPGPKGDNGRNAILLSKATVDEIVQELKQRGAVSIAITW